MLSAGQSAGNILHAYSPFVSAKRARKGFSQPAVTVEVKRWNGKEQLPLLAKRSIFLPLWNLKILRKFKSEGGQDIMHI